MPKMQTKPKFPNHQYIWYLIFDLGKFLGERNLTIFIWLEEDTRHWYGIVYNVLQYYHLNVGKVSLMRSGQSFWEEQLAEQRFQILIVKYRVFFTGPTQKVLRMAKSLPKKMKVRVKIHIMLLDSPTFTFFFRNHWRLEIFGMETVKNTM